jgi:hypothetical protein
MAGGPGFEPRLTESESPRRVLVCHASSPAPCSCAFCQFVSTSPIRSILGAHQADDPPAHAGSCNGIPVRVAGLMPRVEMPKRIGDKGRKIRAARRVRRRVAKNRAVNKVEAANPGKPRFQLASVTHGRIDGSPRDIKADRPAHGPSKPHRARGAESASAVGGPERHRDR